MPINIFISVPDSTIVTQVYICRSIFVGVYVLHGSLHDFPTPIGLMSGSTGITPEMGCALRGKLWGVRGKVRVGQGKT